MNTYPQLDIGIQFRFNKINKKTSLLRKFVKKN